jgi:hypothetical protein
MVRQCKWTASSSPPHNAIEQALYRQLPSPVVLRTMNAANQPLYYRSAAYFMFTLFVYNFQYTIALTYIHYSNKICITECELFILTVTTINLR